MATTSINSSGVKFPDDTVQATASNVTGIPVITQYSTPGSFTKNSSLKAIKVTVIGSGGGGNTGSSGGGGGGGGGGYAQRIYPAASLPSSAVPFTVGAAVSGGSSGNSSSFGASPLTVITATGGSVGGESATQGDLVINAVGGAGGSGSNGNVNGAGGRGESGGRSWSQPPIPTTYVTFRGVGGLGSFGIGSGGPYGNSSSVGGVIIEELY